MKGSSGPSIGAAEIAVKLQAATMHPEDYIPWIMLEA